MRFALVTDVHIGPPAAYAGQPRKLTQYAEPLLEEFVAHVNRNVRPDIALTLGDAIEDETPDADRQRYSRLVEICSALHCPVVHVAGNHDTVNIPDSELGALAGRAGPLYFSWDANDWHLVVLHTREQKDRGVQLPDEQLQWLAADLEQTTLPTLVFVHHPLCEMQVEGNRWFEKAPHLCRAANRRDVRAVLEQSGKVRAVFNGHAHWNYCNVIGGIAYVTLQSLTENVDEGAPGRPSRAHAVVDATATRLVVRVAGEQPCRYQLDWPR